MDWSPFLLLIVSSTDLCYAQSYRVTSESKKDDSLGRVINALQERLAILEVAVASSDVNDQLTDLKREIHDVKQENERLQQRLLRQEENLEQLRRDNHGLCLQKLSPHSAPHTDKNIIQPQTPQNTENIVSIDKNFSDDRMDEMEPTGDGKSTVLLSVVNSISTQNDSKIRGQLVKRQVQEGPIAFHAKLSTDELANLGIHHTIIFDNVVTNIGGGYHVHTGIFIAPIRGIYVFHLSLMASPGKNEFLELVKDGVYIQGVYPAALGVLDFVTSSIAVPLELEKGGEVWVRTTGGMGSLHGNYFSIFTGFLLQQM